MGKGVHLPRVHRPANVEISQPVPEIAEEPNYRPWIIKYNGRRYETVNPWHVTLFTADPYHPDGRVRLSVLRRDPKTSTDVITGDGNGATMWGDEAIDFCLRNFYIVPAEKFQLTADERMKFICRAAFVAFVLLMLLLSAFGL